MKLLIYLIFTFSFFNSYAIDRFSLIKNHRMKDHKAYAKNVMVASQGHHSTRAALSMIKLGGNIYDAFAALSFAISVERPQSTGIGGGGFLIADGPHTNKPFAYDFREVAPLHAHRDMYLDSRGDALKEKSLNGASSVAVPGLVYGVLSIHKKYGKLSRAQVLAPAIKLARSGFKVYPHLAKSIKLRQNVLQKYPASIKIFFKNGLPLNVGDIIIQNDLAKTLETISIKGIKGFYEGSVANAIVNDIKDHGGIITHRDLTTYKAKLRTPVIRKYNDYELVSMPPPSSGGTHVIQIFNILKPLDLHKYDFQSSYVLHRTATAMQLAFVDRAQYMGDSDFVSVPVDKLISKKYAKKLSKKIKDKALELKSLKEGFNFPYESSDTTHFTIMDKEGNTITSTQTINFLLGSGMVIKGTGIVMNDEMDDFAAKLGEQNIFGAVGGRKNLIAPKKRPLSSMSPTIVRKDGLPFFALGTPSGTRILTCVAQVAFNFLEHKLDLYDAVAATRIHHQWLPDVLQIGPPFFSKAVREQLKNKGHVLKKKSLGCKVQAITREKERLYGVSDPRGEGLAKGL